MKKNLISKTIAAAASAAVLGAAAMMSASAAGESLSLTSASGKAGETVTLEVVVACNNNFESLDTVLTWDDTALTSSQAAPVNGVSVASDAGAGYCTVVAYGSDAIPDGTIATIDFTIPANAESGTVYSINFTGTNTFAIFGGDDIANAVPASGGTITVIEEETTEPTTEAPTEESTEAAPTEEETSAPAPVASTKTGAADVAVAVAGLVLSGTIAAVIKKKH